MDIVKLSKSGQISLPKALLRGLGTAQTGTHFAAEATSDGAILLRPVGIFPIEIYSDERIEEFLAEDRATPAERRQVSELLGAAVS